MPRKPNEDMAEHAAMMGGAGGVNKPPVRRMGEPTQMPEMDMDSLREYRSEQATDLAFGNMRPIDVMRARQASRRKQ